jgi:Flp pilus assembly pilin Flp
MKNFVRKFLRNKRAVTPVLSELLLTVIAVAAMSVATTATYTITTNLRENMSERVTVEDVWFNNLTHTIDFSMYNVGEVDVTISAVYINYQNQHLSAPFRLSMGAHQLLHVSYTWNSGDLYYIDLVTDRGTHIAGDYKAT